MPVNEIGTPVSEHVCESCGQGFTVCPAVPSEKADEWRGCLADDCSSYDLARDIDIFWEPLADSGLIERRTR